MTAHVQTDDARLTDAARDQIVRDLATVYPLLLVADAASERIEWMSSGWARELPHVTDLVGCRVRDIVSHLPKPEQAFPIASRLREAGVVRNARVELRSDGKTPSRFDLTVLALDVAGAAPRIAMILRKHRSVENAGLSHSVIASHPEAILAIDAEGFIEAANPAAAALLSTAPDALVGSAAAALVADVEDVSQLLDTLCTRETVEVNFAARRDQALPLAVTGRAAPHSRANGEPGGVVLSLRAADPARPEATELERRNNELEHCVNSLAHDLRSPLVAMFGFSGLLRQDYEDRLDETGMHFIDRIEQAGRTMEGLIHDLLELSRIGQPGEHPAQIDPRSVLVQLAAEFKSRLEDDQVALHIPEAPALVYCDRTRLYQVFSNLIGNALEHMGESEPRRIDVRIDTDLGMHHITVQDSGRGIATEQHERIFDAFQSLGARRDGRRGTGMGLAIVRKIAETRGGRAWVESTPGNGATFHVTLAPR